MGLGLAMWILGYLRGLGLAERFKVCRGVSHRYTPTYSHSPLMINTHLLHPPLLPPTPPTTTPYTPLYPHSPLMINTQRLSSLAFCIADGAVKDQTKLTKTMKQNAVKLVHLSAQVLDHIPFNQYENVSNLVHLSAQALYYRPFAGL